MLSIYHMYEGGGGRKNQYEDYRLVSLGLPSNNEW